MRGLLVSLAVAACCCASDQAAATREERDSGAANGGKRRQLRDVVPCSCDSRELPIDGGPPRDVCPIGAEPSEIAHFEFQGRSAVRLFGMPSGAADANDLVLRVTGEGGPLRVSKCGGDPVALGAEIGLGERTLADDEHWYWESVSGAPPDYTFVLRRARKTGDAAQDIVRVEGRRSGLSPDDHPVLSLDDTWLYWTVPGYRSTEAAAFSGGGVYRTNKAGSGDVEVVFASSFERHSNAVVWNDDVYVVAGDRLLRVPKAGGEPTAVLSDVARVRSLTQSAGFLYLSGDARRVALLDGTVETWYRGTDPAPDIQAVDTEHVYGLTRAPQLALVRHALSDGAVEHVLGLTGREIGSPDVGRKWRDLVVDDRAIYWGEVEEQCIEQFFPPIQSAAPPHCTEWFVSSRVRSVTKGSR